MTTRTRIFDSFCRRRRGRKGTVSLSVSVVVAFLYCCLAFSSAAETSASTSSSSNETLRQVRVFNESPFRIELFLEDDDNQLVSPQEGVLPGGTWKWDVTVGQRYTVYELPDEDTGLCQEQEEEEDDDSACWKTSFVITNGQEQEITITKDFKAIISDDILLARQSATNVLSECDALMHRPELHSECLLANAANAIEHVNEERQFHQHAVAKLGQQSHKYICDDNFQAVHSPQDPTPTTSSSTTTPIRQFQWESHDYIMHTTQVLWENGGSSNTTSTQIHVIPDFIEPEECEAAKSTSRSSNSIPIPWELEDQDHPLAMLGRRILDYTSYVTGTNLTRHSTQQQQEPLQKLEFYQRDHGSIQKQRRLESGQSTIADNNNKPSMDNTIATTTMLMYCQVPTDGGNLYFPNQGIPVKPTVGTAVLITTPAPFSGTSRRKKSTSMMEHSHCPVLEGQMTIITQNIQLP